MKNIFYIFSIVVLSCLSSCYADKGNYDYSSINEITILKMPQEMITAVRYGENLKISVEVKGTKGGEDSYKYEWKAVLKNTYDVSKNSYILGTEKNLDCPITLEENVYVLSLNVQDPASGVTWSQSVDLNVTNYTREGWLILSEQNGKARLDMISRSTEEEIKLGDFLAGYNDPIMKAPKQLILSATMSRPESIILVTEGGTTYLNSDNFYWLPEYNFQNEFGEKEEDPKVKAVVDKYTAPAEFCFTEKNVYVRNTTQNYAIFGMPINKVTGETNYVKVAPAIATNIDGGLGGYCPSIMYDMDNKRFVSLEGSYGTYPGLMKCAAKESVFKNDTGKEFIGIYNTLMTTGMSFTLLRDDDKKVWIYSFEFSQRMTVAQGSYYYQIDAPGIEKATMFAVHPMYYFLFYVSDNVLYQYDIVTKECRRVPYDFGTEKIKLIKFDHHVLMTYGKPQEYKDLQTKLIIGTDGTGEMSGKITLLDFNSVFTSEPTKYREYTGFGKIIDITYRERP